jgi:hypothetical protein
VNRQASYIAVILLAALSLSVVAQEHDIIIGAGKRLVDTKLRDVVLRLIRLRVDTGVVIEPLLIFSPYSDPDVLGSIAIDEDLALPFREVAANAILDQLYIASPYFQAAAQHYLEILVHSSERSLRLKGWVGEAIVEFRLYAFSAEEGDRHLVRLQYSAARETDPRLRQLLDELNEGDPSALIGSAAWSPEISTDKPYRRFDELQSSPTSSEEKPNPWLTAAWTRLKKIRSALESFLSPEPAAAAVNTSATANSTNADRIAGFQKFNIYEIAGFLSRFAATEPVQGSNLTLTEDEVQYFRLLARKKPDPYIRALALGPLCFAPDDVAVEIFIEMLRTDQSPLVRLAAAEALSGYTGDREVRGRMIAVCRMEEDAHVRMHILHSLVVPDPANLAPDVQAFLLSRLREEESADVLSYSVHALGTARLRSAAGLFSRMLNTSRDPVLRARLAEALSNLGYGSRLRNMDNPR